MASEPETKPQELDEAFKRIEPVLLRIYAGDLDVMDDVDQMPKEDMRDIIYFVTAHFEYLNTNAWGGKRVSIEKSSFWSKLIPTRIKVWWWSRILKKSMPQEFRRYLYRQVLESESSTIAVARPILPPAVDQDGNPVDLQKIAAENDKSNENGSISHFVLRYSADLSGRTE